MGFWKEKDNRKNLLSGEDVQNILKELNSEYKLLIFHVDGRPTASIK